MQEDDVLAEFRASKALLEGHFLLSSGRHSAHYLQCARVLMNPSAPAGSRSALAAEIAARYRKESTSGRLPAMGGVIIGHEMGRALGVDAMFVERPDRHLRTAPRLRPEPGDKGADGRGCRHHRPFLARGDQGDRGCGRRSDRGGRAGRPLGRAPSTLACRSFR
jgi:hypothetical protein